MQSFKTFLLIEPLRKGYSKLSQESQGHSLVQFVLAFMDFQFALIDHVFLCSGFLQQSLTMDTNSNHYSCLSFELIIRVFKFLSFLCSGLDLHTTMLQKSQPKVKVSRLLHMFLFTFFSVLLVLSIIMDVPAVNSALSREISPLRNI